MLVHDLNALTLHHKGRCKLYADYVESMFPNTQVTRLDQVPFLPVRAFKDFDIKSIPDDEVFKTMRSSGTTGKQSQIFLDKETAQKQSLALVEGFGDHFGNRRFPMLIIDAESTVKDRLKFSARTAAINGFSMFSRGRCFALNEDMKPDFDRIRSFLAENADKRIFVFGFTFLIWSVFIQELQRLGETLPLENSFFLHGGGWKKLEAEKVSGAAFKEAIRQTASCTAVHNYYGMVEQTGTIFIECENGRLHAARQSGALTRDPAAHTPLEHGRTGLLQIFSTIQFSYPGHSLLTEDVGRTYAGNECPCGREGTIIEIDGRLARAEVRGCSDAYS
jgi:Acyl-protein synthetase, LuxE